MFATFLLNFFFTHCSRDTECSAVCIWIWILICMLVCCCSYVVMVVMVKLYSGFVLEVIKLMTHSGAECSSVFLLLAYTENDVSNWMLCVLLHTSYA
jgi:hypothetical protein